MRHTARRRAKLWTGVIAIILLGLTTAAEEDCETTPQDEPADTVISAPEPTQPSPTHTPALVRSPTPTASPTPILTPVPPSVKDIEELLIPNMESQPEVMDAAVAQDGDDISLVLIVGFATNESRAKEIGENFVRMTKSLMKDGAPGREIGKGKYNYLIGVYYPNEKTVALGAKARTADRLTW